AHDLCLGQHRPHTVGAGTVQSRPHPCPCAGESDLTRGDRCVWRTPPGVAPYRERRTRADLDVSPWESSNGERNRAFSERSQSEAARLEPRAPFRPCASRTRARDPHVSGRKRSEGWGKREVRVAVISSSAIRGKSARGCRLETPFQAARIPVLIGEAGQAGADPDGGVYRANWEIHRPGR